MKTTLTTIFVTLALTFKAHAYLTVPDGALNVRHFHMVERDETGDIVGRSFSNTFDLFERSEYETLERRRCTTINACGTAGGCMVMAGQRYCDGVPWQKSFQDAVRQTGANGVTGLKLMAEGIGRGPVGMLAGVAKATAKAIIDAKKTTNKGGNKKAVHKPAPKKSAPKKSVHKKAVHKKSAHKKAAHRKSAPKKAAPKKAAHRKSAPRKSAPRKSAPRKAAPKKAASRKAAPRKVAPKKPAPKKAANKGGKKKRELADEDVVMNRRDFEIVERDEHFNLVERGQYSTFDLATRNEDGSTVTRRCEMFNGDMSCQ